MKTDHTRKSEIDVFARTLYGEARGEFNRPDGGLSSLIGVGNVIMNRVEKKSWFGKTIQEVCLKPYQFSCWNQSDPNRSLLLSVTPEASTIFKQCLDVAERLANHDWPDLTKGADHYYALWIARAPKWALKSRPVAKIGCHVFYNLENLEKIENK